MTVNDLSPEALSRLEAKLVADLEMVRRVRALLVEHQAALGGMGVPVAPAVAQPPIPGPATVPPPPPLPVRSSEETMREAVLAMPVGGFRPKDLKSKLYKLLRNYPSDQFVKPLLNRMIRRGEVVVLETGKGRGGHLYKCLLPRPEPVETAESGGEAAVEGAGESQ